MDSVRKGDTLSIITNLFGEEVDRVIAPFDGVVIGYWTYSVCPPHGWVYMVGKPVDGEYSAQIHASCKSKCQLSILDTNRAEAEWAVHGLQK